MWAGIHVDNDVDRVVWTLYDRLGEIDELLQGKDLAALTNLLSQPRSV